MNTNADVKTKEIINKAKQETHSRGNTCEKEKKKEVKKRDLP